MSRKLAALVVVSFVAACDNPSPDAGGNPPPVVLSGDAGAFCAEPDEGCPCEPDEEPIDCWVNEGIRDGNHVCGVGTRYCEGGQWGACEHVELYELPAFSVVDRSASAALIAGPGSCNVCDPGCSISTDRPDDGDLTDDNSDNVEYDPGAGGIRLPPSSTGVPSSADRDRDGIPDIADDCPLAPGLPELFGCPAGSGTPGIYHELPFDGPAVTDPCVIDVQVRTVDVYFLVDTTGSMGGELNNLRSGLTSGTIGGCSGGVIGGIRCAIPDAWFGVGYHDDYPISPYGAGSDDVYRNLLDITDNLGAAQTAVNGLTLHNGNDWPESQSQALWSIATGGGLGAFNPAKGGCPGARWGYPCFREDAIPVVVLITDAPFHNGTISAYDYASSTPTMWIRTNSGERSGNWAARSATIGDTGVTAMSANFTLTATTTISFWYRVSSEGGWDFFRVFLDGVEVNQYSGNVGWSQWSRSVGAGLHNLTLVYTKDGSVSSGSDAVWVDDVNLGSVSTGFESNLSPFVSASSFGLSAPTWTDVTNSLVARGIKVISIESSGRNAQTMQDLNALAYATDSVDATGNPFVFSIPSNGTGLSESIVDAVRYLADYSRVDVSAIAIDNPSTPGVDERNFVENIVAASWGPRGSCQSRSGNRFDGCLPGTDTNFQVSFRNDVVMPSATTQVFTFWIRVLFNDSTIAFEKEVRIVVPPAVPACATVEVGAARVIPNIMFLVDRSGSMDSNFGGGRTRWQSSKDAIIGRNGTGMDRGVVGELESTVRFGLQTYAGSCTNPLGGTAGSRTMQLSNWSNINSYFRPADASGSTPTFEALQLVYNQILASPPPDGPPIVVLVTDGEPNGCASNPRAAVVNEVRRAFTAGIRTFVISVGTGVAASHLQDIANAGVGRAAGAPYWVATDPSGLVTAVNTIVVGARSCEMDVTGEIDPDVACLGEVRLGGALLMCNDPATTTSCSGRQGWRRVDDDTIELCGNACTTLLSDPDATLTGQFPCAPITGRYWRTYDATERCEIPPNRAQWGELTWDADFPAGTAITFEIRTADTEAGLDAAVAARLMVDATGPTPPVDVGTLLRTAGIPDDRPFARVTAVLQGSVDRARSPVLTEMTLSNDCIPAE
ncbi:MAG: vWA domain-containing protein [Polyangiales bacterium]